MQIDPEEFRRRYAELSDEALLEINRVELTEIAREYLDLELAGRGLSSGPETEPEPGERADLLPLAAFPSPSEAAMARTLLRSAEIPAYLDSELTSAGATATGEQILVPASFLEQAKEILDAPIISEEELIRQAEAASETEDDPDPR